MNFLLNNGQIIIWIPLYQINVTTTTDNNGFLVLSFLFFLLLFVAAFLSFHFVAILWRIRKFHKNMTIGIVCCFGAWFEVFIAFFLTWPYKLGIIRINNDENPKFAAGFETRQKSEMAVITNFWSSIPLLVGSFMIWHYLASCIGSMCIFVVERSFATFLFNDYEKKSRVYLIICLLILAQFVVLIFVILIYFYAINLTKMIIIGGSFVIVVTLTFIVLLVYNINLRNKLDIKSINVAYTLASKFQVAENTRSLKLAINVLIVVLTITFIAFLLLFLSVKKLIPDKYEYILAYGFEFAFGLNPLFIVPTALATIPEWMATFSRTIPFLDRIFRQKRTRTNNRRLSNEADLYFVQLRNSWA